MEFFLLRTLLGSGLSDKYQYINSSQRGIHFELEYNTQHQLTCKKFRLPSPCLCVLCISVGPPPRMEAIVAEIPGHLLQLFPLLLLPTLPPLSTLLPAAACCCCCFELTAGWSSEIDFILRLRRGARLRADWGGVPGAKQIVE